jgi:glycosyltransferase involved in cell wall biosynthesis
MLSILIPIYNFDCNVLVQSLATQCQSANIQYEILCLDDASASTFQAANASIAKISTQVKYEVLHTNLGRAAIRNVLARRAKYDFLLFLDCDAKVVHSKYIESYLNTITEDKVICGGRVYAASSPTSKAFLLHWQYGKKREQVKAIIRNMQPYQSFMTSNFLIPKHILLAHPFEETLKQYGHEDTLFGLNLQRNGIPLEHIDNPLEHLGLEPIETFLQKQYQAIENLILLQANGHVIATKMLDTAVKLQQLGIANFLKPFQIRLKNLAEQQLRKGSTQLFWLDVWKLLTFLGLQSQFKNKNSPLNAN